MTFQSQKVQQGSTAKRQTSRSSPLSIARMPMSSPKSGCACGGGCPGCQAQRPLRPKLAVSEPGDAFERQADRVAEQIVSAGTPGAAQRAASNGAGLDADARSFFEPRLGADLDGVRLHTDTRAAALSSGLNARAVTDGGNIWFGANEYAPHSARGQRLLVHELAHVAQAQRSPGATPVLQRKPFVITHSSGSTHEVPGLTDNETAFGATGSSSSLMTPAKPRAGRPVTGGFADDLAVDTGFATGAETASDKSVTALIKAGGKRIDARLLPALRLVAKDKFVLAALANFINKDKGTLVAWENDSGHYDGDKSPPTLSIGIGGNPFDTRTTLVHELLHYVFDKSDSILGETKTPGGTEHTALEAVERRFQITDLIRSGKPPLDRKLDTRFGRFLKGDDLFVLMGQAIAKDDRKGLQALADRGDFVKITVSSGLLEQAGSLAFNSPDYYRYTADQFRDLAFIWAQNAVIVRRAMKTAVAVADRTKTPLKNVFAAAEFQKEMSAFLTAFVKGVRKDRTKGAVSVDAGLP